MLKKLFTLPIRNTLNVPLLSKTPIYTFTKDNWTERDRAAEAVYFNKEDEKALKSLLNRLEKDNAFGSGKIHEFSGKEKKEIREILERYQVKPTDALIEELVEWKFK